VFVDASFRPYDDQWAFLAGLDRLSRIQLAQRLQAFPHGSAGGVPLPTTTEADDPEPWTAPPSGRDPDPPIAGPLPASAELVLGDRIYIPRAGLPSPLINRLGRLAAFQNPAFYAAQRMRLSTHATPRVINCGELFAEHIALPRGCLEAARGLLERHGVNCDVRDVRYPGAPLGVAFRGTLTPEQDAARNALLAHETGVLAATTAFGKTVVAASLIAERGVNTLVLVHRRHLLEQWVGRLQSFLDLDAGDVGVVHGGRRRPTGRVDVALIQSLYRRGTVADRVADYGHVVIDECHHVSAVSFEAVARAAKARYVLGLSATVTRKDGHHPIVFMQCGPVRHRVDARQQAAARPFDHRVVFRSTGFRHRRTAGEAEPALQTLYTSLTKDPDRNALILADVRHALEAGRCPVVITERRDHAEVLAGALDAVAGLVVTLRGGLGARERRAAQAALAAAPPSGGRVIVATGRYLGEGFDDARLDTLFLTMPVAWRGTIAQYAGRLHRLHANKRDVVIYDYIDEREPVLARMADKRAAGYRRLGYRTDEPTPLGV
jgi:superfamily II DNA or RNA helicase